jgi:hypothetical protein
VDEEWILHTNLAFIKALVGRHFGELLAIRFSGYLVHNKMAMLVSSILRQLVHPTTGLK